MKLLGVLASALLLHSKAPSEPKAVGGDGAFGRLLQGKNDKGATRGLLGKKWLGAPGREEDVGRSKRKPLSEEPALDSSARQAAQLAPPFIQAPIDVVQPLEAHARASVEDLIPALVRRVAWSGDGKKGTVRLEIDGGELAGATLLVHADAGRIAVHLHSPTGANLAGWRDRITARLKARGLDVEDVEVD